MTDSRRAHIETWAQLVAEQIIAQIVLWWFGIGLTSSISIGVDATPKMKVV